MTARTYYQCPMAGFSVPAAEHRLMSRMHILNNHNHQCHFNGSFLFWLISRHISSSTCCRWEPLRITCSAILLVRFTQPTVSKHYIHLTAVRLTILYVYSVPQCQIFKCSSASRVMLLAPLKLRPNGAIQICLLLWLFLKFLGTYGPKDVYYYYYYHYHHYFLLTSTKLKAWKLKLSKWKMVATMLSLGDYSVMEGDRISHLESYG